MEEARLQYSVEIWNDLFGSKAWGKYPPLSLVRFMARNFYSAPNKKEIRVLELGSGTGANLWYMAREGFTVYGIDGSSKAVELCKQRLQSENLSPCIGELLVENYTKPLPFPDNFFDAIIDVESLYCNPYAITEKLLKHCHEKLKPGGRFFSITFSNETWGMQGAKEISYHTVLPEEGPMKNAGTSRFTTLEDIEKLYHFPGNSIANLEKEERFLVAKNQKISEWVIETVKDK